MINTEPSPTKRVNILTLVRSSNTIRFCSGQVDFQLTCSGGQVNNFEKYQSIFIYINMLISSWSVKIGVIRPHGQVNVNS